MRISDIFTLQIFSSDFNTGKGMPVKALTQRAELLLSSIEYELKVQFPICRPAHWRTIVPRYLICHPCSSCGLGCGFFRSHSPLPSSVWLAIVRPSGATGNGDREERTPPGFGS